MSDTKDTKNSRIVDDYFDEDTEEGVEENIEVDITNQEGTQNIASEDCEVEKNYDVILEKRDNANGKLSYQLKYETISNLVYLCPLSRRFIEKIQNYIAPHVDFNAKDVNRKISDDIIAFEAFVSKEFIKGDYLDDRELLFLQVQSPQCVAEYLEKIAEVKSKKILIVDHFCKNIILIIYGKLYQINSIDNVEIKFNNKTIELIRPDENVINFSVSNTVIGLPSANLIEYGEIVFNRHDFETKWKEISMKTINTYFCLYMLSALYKYIVPEGAVGREELADEIEYCRIELPKEEFNITSIEDKLLLEKKDSLIYFEWRLWQFYECIKSGEEFVDIESRSLFTSKYSEIAIKLKEYYNKHSVEILLQIFDKLLAFAIEEKDHGFYSKYEYILRFLFQLYIHNVFVLDGSIINQNNLYEEFLRIYKNEYITTNRYKWHTLICSYRKELMFGGNISESESVGEYYKNLLNDFNVSISNILNSSKDIESNKFKPELLLLYRERCVIWEHCGDSSVQNVLRLDYYKKWKSDCESAIEISKYFNCDKEILGCVYLNLASSINRLSTINPVNRNAMLQECLTCLDTALDLFKTNAAERNIAYAYLHKADCYEVMLEVALPDLLSGDLTSIASIVKEIRRNSSHALNILKQTNDNIAKCLALRFAAKGKILSCGAEEDLENNFKSGLKSLQEALGYCKISNYINGMAACVKDFTLYIKLIQKKSIDKTLNDLVKKVFFKEMSVFATIIRFLDLSEDDILQLQEQSEKLVSKLID